MQFCQVRRKYIDSYLPKKVNRSKSPEIWFQIKIKNELGFKIVKITI